MDVDAASDRIAIVILEIPRGLIVGQGLGCTLAAVSELENSIKDFTAGSVGFPSPS
jgi:hypothetical protein